MKIVDKTKENTLPVTLFKHLNPGDCFKWYLEGELFNVKTLSAADKKYGSIVLSTGHHHICTDENQRVYPMDSEVVIKGLL